MLVAENHGKVLPEAQNHEDYLTSAVFGHLRYIPPGHFWSALLTRTRASTPDETPLTEAFKHDIADYSRLEVLFWRSSRKHGEPDLVLRFSDAQKPSLILIVEVKLLSGKSGSDENDQLARYLRLLDDLPSIGLPTAAGDLRYLLFLTPRDSLAEINESLATPIVEKRSHQPIYRLQWQDVLQVARDEASGCDEPEATILADVATFLRRRGLEYFDGFRSIVSVDVDICYGRFYKSSPALTKNFTGFAANEAIESFPIQPGAWTA